MYKNLSVQDWMVEIERCLEYRRLYGLEDSWGLLRSLYQNVHTSQSNPGQNIIVSNIETMISTLAVPYPYITVNTNNKQYVDSVGIVETVANSILDQVQLNQEMSLGVLSSCLYGVAIFKQGYDSEYGFDPKYDIKTDEGLGISLTQFNNKGNRIEFGPASPGMPWNQLVMPQDFLVPWGTRNPSTAEYAIHRICRHIDDVRDDVKLNNRRKDVPPGLTQEDFIKTYNSPIRSNRVGTRLASGVSNYADSKKNEYVELWEIHCRRTGRLYVVATGYDKFLRNDPDYMQVDNLPFVGFGLMKNEQHFWRTPLAYYLLQTQLELIDVAVQGSKTRRSNVVKMMIQEGAMSEEEISKLMSPRVSAAVKTKTAPKDAVSFLNPPIDTQQYFHQQAIRENSRETLGFSRNESGQFEPGGRRTAYEVSRVAQGSDRRTNMREQIVADAYTEIMRRLIRIAGTYWGTSKLVKIMDENGIENWKTVTGADLKGDYAFSCELSNSGPRNRQVSRAEALQLLGMFINDPLVDPNAVRRWLIRTFNDTNLQGIYPPEVLKGEINAPLQLQMQQQQMRSSGRSVPSGEGSNEG